MTAFVESCVETVTGSAEKVVRRSRGHPHARHLLKVLAAKQNILITTHVHPDPDALASATAMATLLSAKLNAAKVSVSIKGQVGGGVNAIFAEMTDLQPVAWSDEGLAAYDAIVLVDTQPPFGNSPLPDNVLPTAVIDHHRSRGRRPQCPYCDVRPDVGATGSIVFSYFMELEQPINRDLGATLLFGIESDLAGAAGAPGELDNVALSNLTLVANPQRLYRMRYAPLPQNYFQTYASALSNATVYDEAVITFCERIDSPEQPAVIADFLLRYERVKWALTVAVYNEHLVLSLRTNEPKRSAADVMRRLMRNLGEGGGHRTKAGGGVKLANGTPTEIDRMRSIVRRRFLRNLHIRGERGQKLVNRSA
jgi:nanoRNase/pAp phosphatase (c-di-AMP/oligoRNAs hydrolase)